MKFYKNDIYTVKTGSVVKTYICVGIVKTILNNPINVVIMKQILGDRSSMIFCLNKMDCKRLHIKYEPGLQVFSIDNITFKKQTNGDNV